MSDRWTLKERYPICPSLTPTCGRFHNVPTDLGVMHPCVTQTMIESAQAAKRQYKLATSPEPSYLSILKFGCKICQLLIQFLAGVATLLGCLYAFTLCPVGPHFSPHFACISAAISHRNSSVHAGPMSVTPTGRTGVEFPVSCRMRTLLAASPSSPFVPAVTPPFFVKYRSIHRLPCAACNPWRASHQLQAALLRIPCSE